MAGRNVDDGNGEGLGPAVHLPAVLCDGHDGHRWLHDQRSPAHPRHAPLPPLPPAQARPTVTGRKAGTDLTAVVSCTRILVNRPAQNVTRDDLKEIVIEISVENCAVMQFKLKFIIYSLFVILVSKPHWKIVLDVDEWKKSVNYSSILW